jgi:hypothetical protein
MGVEHVIFGYSFGPIGINVDKKNLPVLISHIVVRRGMVVSDKNEMTKAKANCVIKNKRRDVCLLSTYDRLSRF